MAAAYKRKYDDYSEVELAGIGNRVLARIIDGFVLGGAIAMLMMIFGGNYGAGGSMGFLIYALYEWYCLVYKDGQTFGKTVMGIRVIKSDGTKLTDVDAVIRYLVYYVSAGFMAFGLLWALIDRDKRGWHDILAKTLVVKAR